VKGQPGEIRRKNGVVAGLGCSKIQEVARLYAHLTARQFQGFADTRDLSKSAVVVTTTDYLNANLLHALYSETGVRSCPGLICASGVEELKRQVLVRSHSRSQAAEGRNSAVDCRFSHCKPWSADRGSLSGL
jgi:hypothetical protein